MNERPIIFTSGEVCATLDSKKTQMRRIVDLRRAVGEPSVPAGCVFDICAPGVRQHYGYTMPPNARAQWRVQRICDATCSHSDDVGPYDGRHPVSWGPLPFWPGLRLWVRESFNVARPIRNSEGTVDDEQVWNGSLKQDPRGRIFDDWCIGYKADGCEGSMRSAAMMPRWASRITLEVTSVRVERLQDISEEDAMAEGVEPRGAGVDNATAFGLSYQRGFEQAWQRTNGKRVPWGSNPWMFVVGFKVCDLKGDK